MKHIYNLIILDASGSMGTKVPEVIGGINHIIDDLKKDEKAETNLKNTTTIVDFSSHTDFKVIYDNAPTKTLRHISERQYSARGMTALYDAIGKAFLLIPNGTKDVLVTIFTDGLENDSKEYKLTSIKALIDSKKELGWTITYMGTSQEAMMQASEIGISREYSLSYGNSKLGTESAMYRVNSSRKKYVKAKLEERDVKDIFDKGES